MVNPFTFFETFLDQQQSAFLILEKLKDSYSFYHYNQGFKAYFEPENHLNFRSFLNQHCYKTNKIDEVLNNLEIELDDFELYLLLNHTPKAFLLQNKYFQVQERDFVSIELSLIDEGLETKDINHQFLELSQTVGKIGSWRISSDLKKTVWTNSLKRILEVEDNIEPNFEFGLDFFKNPNEKKELRDALEHTVKTKSPFNIDVRLTTLKSNQKWVNIRGKAIVDSKGTVTYVMGTLQDVTKAKEEQIQLQQRNHFISTVLDNLPIGVAIHEIDTEKPTYLNDAFQNIYGHDKAAISSFDKFFELVYPDAEYREKIKSEVVKDIQSGDPNRMAWQNLKATTAKGDTRYITAKNIPLFEQNIMISTVIDVTDTYLANQETKRMRDRFLYASKAVSDAIWDFDVINDIRYWSKSYQSIFNVNLKQTDVNEAFWQKYIHPDDLESVITSFYKALEDSEQKYWSCYYKFKNGKNSYADVFDNAVIIRNEHGQAVRVVGALKDITQQKKQTDHLKLLETIVENSNEGILISEIDEVDKYSGKISYANTGFTKITGYEKSEIIGHRTSKLRGENTNPETIKFINENLKALNSFEVEILNYDKYNREFWVNLAIKPISNSQGKYTHWVCMQKDITEKKIQEIEHLLIKETNEVLHSKLNLKESFKHIFTISQKHLEYDIAELWLLDPQTQKLKLSYSTGNHPFNPDETKIKVTDKNFKNLYISKVWDSNNNILQIDRVSETTLFLGSRNQKKITSFIVSIINNQEKVGVLIFGYRKFRNRDTYIKKIINNYRTFLGSEIKQKQAEDDLNQIVDFAPDFICIASPSGYIKRVNPFGEELLGFTHGELYKQPFLNFIHPKDHSKFFSLLTNVVHPKTSYSFSCRVLTAQNSYKTISWSFSKSASTNYYYAVGKDISIEVENRKEIKRQVKFQDLLINISSKYINTSQHNETEIIKNSLEEVGQFVNADRAYIFDYNLKNNTASNTFEWCNTNVSSEIENLQNIPIDAVPFWIEMHQQGKPLYVPNVYKLPKDGKQGIRDILEPQGIKSLITFPLRDETSLYGFVGFDAVKDYKSYTNKEVSLLEIFANMLVNIKKRKRYDSQLKQLNKDLENRAKALKLSNIELEQFAQVVSHDLQEPLRMITGFLTQLERKYDDLFDEKAKQYIYYAVDGAQRMRDIILELLEFSKVDKIELKTETVTILDVVNEVKLLQHKLITQRKAKISYTGIDQLQTSKFKLRQVLNNLVENAIKYTEEGKVPLIEIKAKQLKNKVRFSVKDRAIIINKEQQNNIFNIFVRLDYAKQYAGTGIGLAITKKIVNKLGGQINVKQHKNGNEFNFTIAQNDHNTE